MPHPMQYCNLVYARNCTGLIGNLLQFAGRVRVSAVGDGLYPSPLVMVAHATDEHELAPGFGRGETRLEPRRVQRLIGQVRLQYGCQRCS